MTTLLTSSPILTFCLFPLTLYFDFLFLCQICPPNGEKCLYLSLPKYNFDVLGFGLRSCRCLHIVYYTVLTDGHHQFTRNCENNFLGILFSFILFYYSPVGSILIFLSFLY